MRQRKKIRSQAKKCTKLNTTKESKGVLSEGEIRKRRQEVKEEEGIRKTPAEVRKAGCNGGKCETKKRKPSNSVFAPPSTDYQTLARYFLACLL